MTLSDKIYAFTTLGKYLKQFTASGFNENPELSHLNKRFAVITGNLINDVHYHNPWFIAEFVTSAFNSIAGAMEEKNLHRWLSAYPDRETENTSPLNIGVIMAGNIPLVGFHDLMSVLFSGNKLTAHLSSKDDKLLPSILAILNEIHPGFSELISFDDLVMKNMDAVIATGSDNSARYFEYYFRNKPHIIRKNRNSAAVLTGDETGTDLELLADDIFMYFGLGCRNVSKLYLPKGYNIPGLPDHFSHYAWLANHNKYANNYEYQRAILLINHEPHFDTGFLLIKEDPSYSSPVGCLHYEFYTDTGMLQEKLEKDNQILQCIVSQSEIIKGGIKYGTSQNPMLWDYADNVDTLKFLLNLSQK